jgi:hypothetical protein
LGKGKIWSPGKPKGETMSTVSIEQMNEVIARFMGLEGTSEFLRQNYQIHKDWQLLMVVVDKIESLENRRFGVCIDVLDTMIMDYKVGFDEGEKIIVQTDIYPDNGDTKISITHDAVYQFVTWYNSQHKSNNDE